MDKILAGSLHQAVCIGLSVKGKAVLVGVGELYAHRVKYIPGPLVVCVKLSRVVKAPLVDDSAVVGNDIPKGGVCDYGKVPSGEGEGVRNLLDSAPERGVKVDVIVDRLEHSLDALHGIGSRGACSRRIEVGSLTREHQIRKVVKPCRPLGLYPFNLTAVLLGKGEVSSVDYLIL